ncbi:MAG: hypothetical protein IJ603_07505 [Bacteroidales bacterium]|nr:hypothetical protein [Bacteroidales bacterium]
MKDINGHPVPGIFGCRYERKFQWSGEGTYIDYDRSGEPSSYQDVADWYFHMEKSEYDELTRK